MGNVLGIDIGDDFLTAVLLKSGLQSSQIIDCARVPLADADGDFGKALDLLLGGINHSGAVCYCTLPCSRLTYRNLAMPFSDARKIRQTLPFELESLLASPVDSLVIDFTIAAETAGGSAILAAAANRVYLGEVLSAFTSRGLEPEVFDIQGVSAVKQLLRSDSTPADGLLVNLGQGRCSVIYFLQRRIVLIRQLPFRADLLAASAPGKDSGEDADYGQAARAAVEALSEKIRLTLNGFAGETGQRGTPARLFLTGPGFSDPRIQESFSRVMAIPVEVVDFSRESIVQVKQDCSDAWDPLVFNNALALTLRPAGSDGGFNFRRGEFQVRKQFVKYKQQIRTAAVLLLLILVFAGLDLGVEYYGLQQRSTALNDQLNAIFSQTFPEVKKIVDPVQQMRSTIDGIKQSSVAIPGVRDNRKVLTLLADISERIPPTLDVLLNRLVVDPEGIQLKGTTDNFNTVDSIKKGLEASDYYRDITISSANLDRSGKGVQFEIRMQRKE